MANAEDKATNHLKESVKRTLEANGELNKIRAHLRLEVLNIFREPSSLPMTNFGENKRTHFDLVNELVLEYLQWLSFNYSAEVFACESGQKAAPFDRNRTEQLLEKSSQSRVHFVEHVPLLLCILNGILDLEKLNSETKR